MARPFRAIAYVLLISSVALPACGGGSKKPAPKKAVTKASDKVEQPTAETDEDREAQRMTEARKLVPEGSNCLPVALQSSSAPRLELAAIDGDAIVCAIDNERERLLGPVACWKVELSSGGVEYQKAMPLPGRGVTVKIENQCARGYCLKESDAKIAHMVWSPDGKKVAVNADDNVHLFDAVSKSLDTSFTIRGELGVAGDPMQIFWVGPTIFIEAVDGGATTVYQFGVNGAAGGPLEALARTAKPLAARGGSFVILDKDRVAIAEEGFSTVTTYDVATGKRAKLVRKVPKSPCKAADTQAYWNDSAVPAKCKDHMAKNFSHLVGADAVAGKKNLLALLREPRVGELVVLDAKNLTETRSIKLAWCDDESGGTNGKKADKADKADKKSDPDEGGE